MTEELKLDALLEFKKTVDGRNFDVLPGLLQRRFDITGCNPVDKIVTVGTAKETISLDDIGTAGYIMLVSLEPDLINEGVDPGNFVSYGQDADSPHGELGPGDFAIYKATRTSFLLTMKADTAEVRVRVVGIPAPS